LVEERFHVTVRYWYLGKFSARFGEHVV